MHCRCEKRFKHVMIWLCRIKEKYRSRKNTGYIDVCKNHQIRSSWRRSNIEINTISANSETQNTAYLQHQLL